MPGNSTPTWAAAQSGIVGDAAATAGSAQVNQLLGTHPASAIYQGVPITSNINYDSGTTRNPWVAPLGIYDIDQPFTMSGSKVGRVTIGMLPVGQGADVLVSLCADSAGAPGTVISQTRIPASWIYQLSALAGTATDDITNPGVQYTGNALATSQFLAAYRGFGTIVAPYPVPAPVGVSAASSSTWYYPYMIQIGGVQAGAALNAVLTTRYDEKGFYGTSVQQPAFPTTNDGSSESCVVVDPTTGTPVVINAGGGTSFSGAPVASVYASTLDPNTGVMSAWTQQQAMPYPLQNQGIAASPAGNIYMVAGATTSHQVVNTVIYANVQNGQVGTWNYTTPLPQAIILPFVAVAQNFLFVMGGGDPSFHPQSSAWYAQINDDGSLGDWISCGPLPQASLDLNGNAFANDYMIICPSGQGAAGGTNALNYLPVTASGPGTWTSTGFQIDPYPGFFDSGDGAVSIGSISYFSTPPQAFSTSIWLGPIISVPLPASGLTSGATYHILIQQQGGDLNNYVSVAMTYEFPIAGQSSPPGQYTWAPWSPSSPFVYGAGIVVYDNSGPPAAALPLHTWEDNGARITTLVCATTPDQRLMGACEATRIGLALNSNQGFETGIAPWTVTGGTVAQSMAEVFEGRFAAQVTPSGTDATVFLSSELLPCMPGQSITATARLWFTNAVTSNVSVSINWFSSAAAGGGYISTSSNNVSASAATWTDLVNAFTAPAGAYQFTINPALSGTPAASQVFYVDAAYATQTFTGPQQSTVSMINYPGTWPGATWPPLGITELA